MMNPVYAGLYRQDLAAALRPAQPVREERVEAVALYLRSDTLQAVWTVLDFMDLNLQNVRILTQAIEHACGIPSGHIHILTTHNHGGGTPDWDTLAQLTAQCAQNAMERATPAVMRGVTVPVPGQVSFRRRMFVPELNASTTLFYGASARSGYDSAPHTEHVLQQLREGRLAYDGQAETGRPYAPYEPADPLLTAVEFRTEDGSPIGSLVRFAAHAVCSNLADSFSGDYPFRVRAAMERKCGGTSLFLNGPCAEIAPGIAAKNDGTSETLGELLAETAVSALRTLPFLPVTGFDDAKTEVLLPVRAEVRAGCVDISAEMPETLPERLRWLEARNTKAMMGFLQEKYREGEPHPGSDVPVSLGFLRLNDLIFAAFPGETFSETGEALRSAFPELHITTVTEHGRTVMYLPPKRELERGGYETVCRVTGPDAAETLLLGAENALSHFLER